MKKKIYFLSVIFSLFALSGILTSCENLNWFANFMDDLNALKVPFTFYSAAGGTGTSFEKSYIIGKTISGEQLVNDSKDFILKNGADGSTPYRSHAVVHGLKKSSVSSGDDGVVVDGNGIVTSVNVKEAVSFIPVIWYKAILKINLQDLDNPIHYTFLKSFNLYGPENNEIDDSSFVNSLYNFPGFEFNSYESNKFFSSFDVTEVGVNYARKTITLTFNANGGSFTSGNDSYEITKPFETLTEGYVPQDPERSGYDFMGWNPPVPETFPADDAEFTAVWSVTPQNITYKTVNAYDDTKHFYGLIRNEPYLPGQYTPGEKTIIPNPEILLLQPSDNEMLFDGWYYIKTGNILEKLPATNGKYNIPDEITTPLTLYAKWLPKYVYVDPINSTSGCNGFEKASPVKTIADAKKLMKDNLHGQEIRVVGTLNVASDINELSETYGDGCGFGADTNGDGKGDGVIIVPVAENQLMLVPLNKTASISNVVIGRDSEVSIGYNMLIGINPNAQLTLGSGCLIQNIVSIRDYNINNGLINTYGKLILDGAEIEKCKCNNIVNITSNDEGAGSVNINSGKIVNCTGTGINVEKLSGGDGLTIEGGIIKDNTVDINTKFKVNLSDYDQIDKLKLSDSDAFINIINNVTSTFKINLLFDPNEENFVGKQILKSEGTPSISSNKLKFNLPTGYLISDAGYLTKTTGEINITTPTAINEHLLGCFDASDVVIESGGKIIFKVSDDAYTYIANWGSEDSPEKYVMYQISCSNYNGRTFKAKINSDNQSGYHTVELPIAVLVPTDNAASFTLNLDQLPVGLYEISVFVETAPDKIATDSVTGVREMILFHK